jgi:hypothetical protein
MCVSRHQIHLALAGEAVDQLVGDQLALAAQLELIHGCEGLTDRPGMPLMFRPLGEQHGGLVGDRRHQRPVGRNDVPGVPPAGVAPEELGVAEDVAELAVAEH